MINLVLLGIALTACPMLAAAAEINNGLTLAVTIDSTISNEYLTMVRYAVQRAAAATGVDLKIVEVGNDLSEKQLCHKVMEEGNRPAMMIDATLKHSASGNRISNLVKKFARDIGLPTVSTSYSHGHAEEPAWKALTKREKEWLIHVQPPGDVLPNAIGDLARHYNFTTATIFYDSSFEVQHKLDSIMDDTNARYTIKDMDTVTEEVLDGYKKYYESSFFVLGSLAKTNKFLDLVQKKNLFQGNAWFVITKSRAKLKCLTCHLGTVHLMQPMKATPLEYNHTSLLSGLTLENKVDSYFYYDLTRTLVDKVHELMATDQWPTLTYPSCDRLIMSAAQVNERITLRLARELSMEGHYGQFGRFIFDNYQSEPNYQDIVLKTDSIEMWANQPYLIDRMFEWTVGFPYGRIIQTNMVRNDHDEFANANMVTGRKNTNPTDPSDTELWIAVYVQEPFIMKKYYVKKNATDTTWQHTNNVELYGYCIELLEMVRKKMANGTGSDGKTPWKWTPKYYEVKSFGRKVSSGQNGEKDKWDGVIGELAENKADIGLGPIAVMAERETVVDFTVPYYDLVGINILVKKASVPSHLFKFLTVLENNVWFSILGAYFVVSVLLYIYDRFSPYSFYNNKEGWSPDDPPRRDFNFKECLWFSMTSLTPQGGGEAPLNFSGRVAAGTWWLFGFVVIASYTANLAAFLTVSRLDSTIENLDHLSNQFRIRYAPQNGTQAHIYFQRMSYIERKFYEIWKNMSLSEAAKALNGDKSKFAVWDYPISDKYTKMLEQMEQAIMPLTYHEGVRRTKASRSAQEGFAFIAEATQVKFAVLTNCDLQTIGNEFSRKPMALVVQQNSTLKDRLSSAILKLLNERKLEALKEKWWDQYRRVCEDTKKSSDGISIHNIGGVFIVIFIGVILACITLVFEYIFLRRKHQQAARESQVTSYNNIFKNNATAQPVNGVAPPRAPPM